MPFSLNKEHAMVFVRSLAYFLVMVLSIALYSIPIVLIGWALTPMGLAGLGAQWARVNLVALRVICGLDYRVTGAENLPSINAIVLCKHQSTWETISLLALMPRPQTWVVKQELLRVPVFGWSLAQFKPIALDRSAGRKAMRQLLEQGARALEQGRWIILFPEGTRVAAGEQGRYGQGGAMLAERTGTAIVPVAHNAGVFWARRGLHKRPGVIDVVIGPAIETKGRRAQDINREVEDWIEARVAELPGSGA
jgi:1-acyl-sn-glycerol-3-phosphate acyltransferase